MAVDPIILFINLYMEKNNLSHAEFGELNKKYSILKHISENYDEFDKMNDKEILDSIQKHIESF